MADIYTTLVFANVILSYIVGILQIYGVYRFKSIQHLLIIQKRYPKFVIIESIVVIFSCIVAIPLVVNMRLELIKRSVNVTTYKIVDTVAWSINPPCSHFIVNIEAMRLWLIYFNLNYLHSSKQSQWKSVINHTFAESNWFITNKKTYGNIKYIGFRVMIYYIISASISTIAMAIFHTTHLHFAQLTDGALYTIPVTFMLYLYWKCPQSGQLNELFYIHYEFRLSAIFFGTGLVIYLANTSLYWFDLEQLFNLTSWTIGVFACGGPSLLRYI